MNDEAMEVRFNLRLPGYLTGLQIMLTLNHPGAHQARELRDLQCWSSNQNNTIKDTSPELPTLHQT